VNFGSHARNGTWIPEQTGKLKDFKASALEHWHGIPAFYANIKKEGRFEVNIQLHPLLFSTTYQECCQATFQAQVILRLMVALSIK
jgi:hypothetical protein